MAGHPEKLVLVLTYSKLLQLETHLRLRQYPNAHVRTFHSMAGLLFGYPVRGDAELWDLRRKDCLPQWDFPPYDIIVLDEFQDCTDLLFWLVHCFVLANNYKKGGEAAHLVILGDERQAIFPFRGADPRYLSLAHALLKPLSPYSFAPKTLDHSYRLSEESSCFINDTFLKTQYIHSSKPGPKPIVLRCDPRDSSPLAEKLLSLILKYGAENTAIIAPSIRNNRPLKSFINLLSKKYHVQIAVPIGDGDHLDNKVIAGKLSVSTIHGFKGRERDLVINFDINSSYFQYFASDAPDDRCPNEIFVALTRAKQQLVLVHDEKHKLMPFVSVDALYKTAEVIKDTANPARIARPDAPGRFRKIGLSLPQTPLGVQDMTRHLQDETLSEIIEHHLRIRQLSPPLPKSEHVDIQSIVSTDRANGPWEAVSDINGLVIVAAVEYMINGSLHTLNLDQNYIRSVPNRLNKFIPWICRRACKYQADTSGYKPRLNQMKYHKFNWIEQKDFVLAQNRLLEELKDSSNMLKFEVGGAREFLVEGQTTPLQGRADIVALLPNSSRDGESIETIWEIKYVSQLSNEHILQACVYSYLLASASGGIPRTLLYNVRDGEKLEISPHHGQEGLRQMIEDILKLKYTTKRGMTDEEFIERCAKTTQEVLSYPLAGQGIAGRTRRR